MSDKKARNGPRGRKEDPGSPDESGLWALQSSERRSARDEQWWSDGRRRRVKNVNRHNSGRRFVNTHCPSRSPGCLRAARDDSRTADMTDCFPRFRVGGIVLVLGGGGKGHVSRRAAQTQIQDSVIQCAPYLRAVRSSLAVVLLVRELRTCSKYFSKFVICVSNDVSKFSLLVSGFILKSCVVIIAERRY